MSLRTKSKLFSKGDGNLYLPELLQFPTNVQWRMWNIVAIVLVMAFLWQDISNVQWLWLQELQAKEWYKYLSGMALLGIIVMQWWLTVVRVRNQKEQVKVYYRRHQWVGALAPLFFYAHSMDFGYAYLAVLSSVFFLNLVVGVLNPTVIRVKNPQYKFWWVVGHVFLAVLTAVIACYHAYVALYYK